MKSTYHQTVLSNVKMPLWILLPLLLVQEVVMDLFQPMSESCIYWDSLDICINGRTEKLHCIPDENNELGIVNATWKRIQPGYCPYFDRYSKQIDAKPCNAALGKCPEESVLSYQAVKYSACYNILQRNEINKTNTDEQDRTTSCTQNTYHTENCKSWPIIVTLLSAAAIVTVLLGLYIYEKNQQKRKKPKRESISEDSNSQLPVDEKSMEQNGTDPLLGNQYQMKNESISEDGNSQLPVDEKPVEPNGNVPSLEKKYQTKNEKDELMNLCWKLVKGQFEKEQIDLGILATDIPEEEREYMREKLQKVLNALSTNTC